MERLDAIIREFYPQIADYDTTANASFAKKLREEQTRKLRLPLIGSHADDSAADMSSTKARSGTIGEIPREIAMMRGQRFNFARMMSLGGELAKSSGNNSRLAEQIFILKRSDAQPQWREAFATRRETNEGEEEQLGGAERRTPETGKEDKPPSTGEEEHKQNNKKEEEAEGGEERDRREREKKSVRDELIEEAQRSLSVQQPADTYSFSNSESSSPAITPPPSPSTTPRGKKKKKKPSNKPLLKKTSTQQLKRSTTTPPEPLELRHIKQISPPEIPRNRGSTAACPSEKTIYD